MQPAISSSSRRAALPMLWMTLHPSAVFGTSCKAGRAGTTLPWALSLRGGHIRMLATLSSMSAASSASPLLQHYHRANTGPALSQSSPPASDPDRHPYPHEDTVVARTVPKSARVARDDIQRLTDFIDTCGDRLVVLSGAGASTMSGVPDYRSPGVGLYVTTNHKPTQFHEFVGSEERRKRYWARNYVAFPSISKTRPNATHEMLAQLEASRRMHYLITQNVDRLHTVAGSVRVIELHGNGQVVVCLKCKNKTARSALQPQLDALNVGWTAEVEGVTPDGDVNLINAQEAYARFRYPNCKICDGLLKPDVTFFGENVPAATVEFCRDRIRESTGVLVVGSSLTVYSGYRFAKFAKDIQKKLAILNIGETRADDIADLKVEGNTSWVLERVCKELGRK